MQLDAQAGQAGGPCLPADAALAKEIHRGGEEVSLILMPKSLHLAAPSLAACRCCAGK